MFISLLASVLLGNVITGVLSFQESLHHPGRHSTPSYWSQAIHVDPESTELEIDPETLCIKRTVLSIEDAKASKYGSVKGWMTREDWEAELYKISPAEHKYVQVGIDGFPCAWQGCCQHYISLRSWGSDASVAEYVLSEYATVLKGLLPWQPKTILDGGGNIGMATSLFAFMYPNAKIFTLEPEPDNCYLLKHNTKHFKNVEVECVGLWDKDEVSVRVVHGRDDAQWGWRIEEVPEGTENAIKTTSVPALLKKHGLSNFDLVKLDIEGAEYTVFAAGADKQWLNSTSISMMELHKDMGDAEMIKTLYTDLSFEHSYSGEYDVFAKPGLLPHAV